MVSCHPSTLQDASANLGRADTHLRDAYRDSMAIPQSPHLSADNHDQVIDTLTDTIEVTIAIEKARPALEAAIDQLRRDPSSVERIGAAREQIGRALPYLNHARTHAASAAGTPLDGSETPLTTPGSPRPELPTATAASVSRGMAR